MKAIGHVTKDINPVKQAQLIRSLVKSIIRREPGSVMIAMESNLTAMDNFTIEVAEVDNPGFKSKQYVFRVVPKARDAR